MQAQHRYSALMALFQLQRWLYCLDFFSRPQEENSYILKKTLKDCLVQKSDFTNEKTETPKQKPLAQEIGLESGPPYLLTCAPATNFWCFSFSNISLWLMICLWTFLPQMNVNVLRCKAVKVATHLVIDGDISVLSWEDVEFNKLWSQKGLNLSPGYKSYYLGDIGNLLSFFSPIKCE